MKAHGISAAAVLATLRAGELVGVELPTCDTSAEMYINSRLQKVTICLYLNGVLEEQQGYRLMHLHEPSDYHVELRFCFVVGRFKQVLFI